MGPWDDGKGTASQRITNIVAAHSTGAEAYGVGCCAGTRLPRLVFGPTDHFTDLDIVDLFALLQIEPAGGLSEALSSSPLLAMGAMFGAGILTSLTPCVYPMIPITAAVIACPCGCHRSAFRDGERQPLGEAGDR